jgi:biopolymer transport protein ExbD
MRKKKQYGMSLYQKKYRCDRVVREFEEIDITSLLDILVILLVFLLKSYNASSLQVDLVKDLSLADSYTRELGQFAPVLQVTSKKDIYLDNKFVANISDSFFEKKLEEILTKFRANEVLASSKKPTPNINIVIDGDILYQDIDKVINLISSKSFEEFKLIVKGNYN